MRNLIDIYKYLKFSTPHNAEDLCGVGIYAIRNVISGKIYIGQTYKSFIERFLEHQGALYKNEKRVNKHLLNSFKKYGIECFEVVIQERCPAIIEHIINHRKDFDDNDIIHTIYTTWLNEHESFWINYYRRVLGESNVYNLCMYDGAGRLWFTPEMRKHIGDAVRKRYEDPKERLATSIKLKEIMSDPKMKAHLSNLTKERWKDPEYHAKHTASLQRAWDNPEIHARRAEAIRKCTSTDEYRKKASEAQLKNYAEHPERKDKQRATRKKNKHLYFESRSLISRKKWTNQEYRQKVVSKTKKKKAYKQQCLNAALAWFIQQNPRIEHYFIRDKVDLILQIASLLSKPTTQTTCL